MSRIRVWTGLNESSHSRVKGLGYVDPKTVADERDATGFTAIRKTRFYFNVTDYEVW